MAVRVQHLMRGPSAPWCNDDEIEYVGDDVLFAEARDTLADILAENLEARAKVLRENPKLPALEEEIRLQMSVAASKGNYGTVRELDELLIALYLSKENTRRAV